MENNSTNPSPSISRMVSEVLAEPVNSFLASATLVFAFLLTGSLSVVASGDQDLTAGYSTAFAAVTRGHSAVLGDTTTMPSGTVYPDARTVSPVKCRGGQLQTGQFCVYNFIDFATGQHFVYPAPETATNQNPYITTAINNDWDNGIVKGTSGRKDNVSIRWVGNIEFKKGLYAFNTRSDDGIRMSVNSSRINLAATNGTSVEAYADHGPADFKGYAYIETPGVKELVVEYYEKTGLAVARVSWDYLGETGISAGTPRVLPNANTPAELLGVTHVGGLYHFTNESFVEEGANAVGEVGSRTIGIWLDPLYNSSQYPGSNLPNGLTSLKSLASQPQFQKVWGDSRFDTYLVTAYTFSNYFNTFSGPWNAPVDQAIYNRERDEMKDLALYLSTTYPNKYFIIKNWEGDWQLQQTYTKNGPDAVPSAKNIEAMTNWLKARHEGVVAAQKASGLNNLADAVEMNTIRKCDLDGVSNCVTTKPSMINSVFGNVDSTYVSYSSYESTDNTTREKMLSDINYIKSHPNVKGRPLIISEFVSFAQDPAALLKTQTQAFLDAGVVRALYWEIYDNTCQLTADKQNQVDPNCKPFGLVDLHNKKTVQWQTMYELVKGNGIIPTPAATCPEVTSTTSVALNTLTGCYFDDLRMREYKFNKLEVNDPAGNLVNYNWGLNSPDSRLQPDTFSVRWTGNFNFSEAGNYKFTARADDGIRAWVDGQALLLKRADGYANSYTDQGETEYIATKELTAGVHNIKVEYYENSGLAVAKFRYDKVTTSTTEERPRINTPAVGATVNGKEVSVTATTGTMVGVTKMSLIIDDKIVGDMQSIGPANFYLKNFDSTLYSNGAHKIEVVATVSASTGVSAGFYYSGSQLLNINNTSTSSTYSIIGVQRFNQNVSGTAAYITTDEMVVGQYMILYGTFPSTGAEVWIGGEQVPASNVSAKVSPTATTDQINVFLNRQYPLTSNPTGYYSVVVKKSGVSSNEKYIRYQSTQTTQVCPTPQVINGIVTSCYYNDKAPVYAHFQATDLADVSIVDGPTQDGFMFNKDWGYTSPSSKVNTDHFSATYQGYFPFDGGEYKFTARTDDGMRVWVEASGAAYSVLDKFIDQGATTFTNTIKLPAGNHLVKVEYYENSGLATASLRWDKVTSNPTTKAVNSVSVSPYTASNGQTGYIKGYPVQVSWTASGITSFNAQLFIKSTDGSITPNQVFRTNITGNAIPNGAPIPTSVGTGAKAFIRICENTGSFQDCNNGTTYKDSDEFTISEITNKTITAVTTSPYTTPAGQSGYIKGYPVSVSWTASNISNGYSVELMYNDNGIARGIGILSTRTTSNSGSYSLPTSIGTGGSFFVRVCEYTTGTCTNGTSNVFKDSAPFTAIDYPSSTPVKAITAVITAPYTTSGGTTGYFKGYPVSVSWTSTGLTTYTVELMLKFPDGSVGTAGGFVSKTTATSVSLPIPSNIGNGATGFVRVCEWTTGTCTNGYSDVYKDSSTFSIYDLIQGGTTTTTTGYYQAETGTTIVSPMQSATDSANVGHVFTPQANSGSVTIPFTTNNTQTYLVWAKVIAPDSASDSFVVSIDGGAEDIFDTNDVNTNGTVTYVTRPTWQWVKVNGRGGTSSPAIIGTRGWSLAPGAHTITFKGRDANTKLDQIFITANQTAIPSN